MSVTTGEIVAGDGARIAYSLHEAPKADAPSVLLIHALAMDRSNWDSTVDLLSTSFHVLMPDLRGHGRSEGGDGPFSESRHAADLAAIVEAIGWDKVVVAGCSMGGDVALAFALDHPQRTRGLVLIDTTAHYGDAAGRNWADRKKKARSEGFPALLDFQKPRWFSERFLNAHPELVQKTVDVFVKNRIENYERSCDMLAKTDFRHRLKDIAVPTAVLVGEEDHATPLPMSEALAAGIAGATLKVIEGAKHFTPIERPDVIAAAIRDVASKSA